MASFSSVIAIVLFTFLVILFELKQYGSASAAAASFHDYGEPLMGQGQPLPPFPGHPGAEDDENNFLDTNSPWDTGRRANRFNIDTVGGPPRLDNRVRIEEALKPRPRCDRRIRIANGVTRVRDKGTLVRFQCSYGFHMLGAGVAVCSRGQWSDPPPTCVREGCRTMPIPLHGSLRQLYGGGVAVFSCNYGFLLDGDRVLTCDGQKWNGTAPICVEIPPITIAPPITTYSPPSAPEPFPGTGTPSPVPTAPGEIPIATASENGSIIIPPILEIPNQENTTTISAANETNPTTVTETTTLTPDIIGDTIGVPMASPTPFLVPQPEETTPMTIVIPVTTTDLVTRNDNDTSESTTITDPIIVTKGTQDANSELTTTVAPEIPTTAIPVTKKSKPTKAIKPTKPPKTSKPFFKAKTPIPTVATSTEIFLPEPEPETEKPTMIIYTDPTQPSMSPPKALNPNPRNDLNNDVVSPLHPIIEKVEIIPEKLGNSYEDDEHDDSRMRRYDFGHVLVVVGITLIAIGLVTIAGGVFTYYWRKNKGIARPNSYDLDGRTLSTHDGNDEFLWVDNRGDRDSGGL